jgi:GNAT superfamily N-acetyltransferase
VRIRSVTEGDVPILERMMLLAGFPPDRPLGAAWAREFDEPLLVDDAGAPVAEVAIAVEPYARAKGLGTALLPALERAAAAAGHRELCLSVSPRNPAVRLYERAGYERVRDGEHGLVMRRPIDQSESDEHT